MDLALKKMGANMVGGAHIVVVVIVIAVPLVNAATVIHAVLVLVLLDVVALLIVHPGLVLQKVRIIIVKLRRNIVVVRTIVVRRFIIMVQPVTKMNPIPSALLLQVVFIYVSTINQMQHGPTKINVFPFQKVLRGQRL
jgi:hypothetical protein